MHAPPYRDVDAVGIGATPRINAPGSSATAAVAAEPNSAAEPATTEAAAATAPPMPLVPPVPQFPVVAQDAAGIAAQILEAELAARDPATPADQMAFLAHKHQRAYRLLIMHPEWLDAVVAAMPTSELQQNVLANNHINWYEYYVPRLGRPGAPSRPTHLPRWCIVEAEPLDKLMGAYQHSSKIEEMNLDPLFLAAIQIPETRMGRLRGYSWAGAEGPMQFMPDTWVENGAGGDPWNDLHAFDAAAHFTWASGAKRGDYAAAAERFNPIHWYVNAVLGRHELFRRDPASLRIHHGYQVYVGTHWLPPGFPNNLAVDSTTGAQEAMPFHSAGHYSRTPTYCSDRGLTR